ncbi:hypothetical protein [Alteromonas gracilis]|uniref:hypothetical protein n=1 Tax=Alteromonas gracilis TaxID=1479524 RepID=UPI003735AB3A
MTLENTPSLEASMLHEDCPGNCNDCALFTQCDMPYKDKFTSSSECYWLMQDETFILANEATKQIYKVDDPVDFVGLTPACVSPKAQPCGLPSSVLAAEAIAHTKKFGESCFNWMGADINGDSLVPMKIQLNLINSDTPSFILAKGQVSPSLFFPDERHIAHVSQQLEELFLTLINTSTKSDMSLEDQISFFKSMLTRVIKRANEEGVTAVSNIYATGCLISHTLHQLLEEKAPSEWLIIAFLESFERTLNLPDGELSTSPVFYRLLKALV